MLQNKLVDQDGMSEFWRVMKTQLGTVKKRTQAEYDAIGDEKYSDNIFYLISDDTELKKENKMYGFMNAIKQYNGSTLSISGIKEDIEE